MFLYVSSSQTLSLLFPTSLRHRTKTGNDKITSKIKWHPQLDTTFIVMFKLLHNVTSGGWSKEVLWKSKVCFVHFSPAMPIKPVFFLLILGGMFIVIPFISVQGSSSCSKTNIPLYLCHSHFKMSQMSGHLKRFCYTWMIVLLASFSPTAKHSFQIPFLFFALFLD